MLGGGGDGRRAGWGGGEEFRLDWKGGGGEEADGVSCLLNNFLEKAGTMLRGMRRGEREEKRAERDAMIYTGGRKHAT